MTETEDIGRLIFELQVRVDSASGEEAARLTGEIGQLLLFRFERAGSSDDLDVALSYLIAATVSDHRSDYPLWAYIRGQVHRYLGSVRRRDGRNLALAIHWMQRAYRAHPHPDVDTDCVAADLAELYWDRYKLRVDPDVDILVDSLNRLAITSDELRRSYLKMLTSGAYLERWTERGDRADYERGVSGSVEALDSVPTDTVRLSESAARLAQVYLTEHERTGDVNTLDRAIYIASRFALIDDEESHGARLLRILALGLCAAWDHDRDPHDLDAAIRTLQRALAQPPNVYGPERFNLWHEVARRRAQRWLRLRDPAEVPLIADAYRQAFGFPAPNSREYLQAWAGLISVTIDQLRLAVDGTDAGVVDDGRVGALVGSATAALDQHVEAGTEVRAALASKIVGLHLFTCGRDLRRLDVGLVRRLLPLASRHSGTTEHMYERLSTVDVAFDEKGDDAIAAIIEALRFSTTDAGLTRTLEQLLAVAKYVRAGHVGELRDLDVAAIAMVAADEGAAAEADSEEVRTLAHFAEIGRRLRSDDLAGAEVVVGRAIASLQGAPLSEWGTLMMSFLRSAQWLFEVGLGGSVRAGAELAEDFIARAPFSEAQRNAMSIIETSMLAVAAQTAGDFEWAAELLPDIEEALDGLHRDERLPMVRLLVELYHRQAGYADRELAPVEATIRWAREAQRIAAGHMHPMSAQISMHLAEALRRRVKITRTGGAAVLAESRALGLEAMRTHASQVFLQSGTEYAVAAAQQASADAFTLAHWCVEDATANGKPGQDELAELVRALDAGRGLVLHATTVSEKISEVLAAKGHRELAVEWQKSLNVDDRAEPVSAIETLVSGTDVRYRVLRTLAADRGDLLGPPSLAEIGGAIADCGVDALVYLVGGPSGFAVVVRPGGEAALVPLPELSTDVGSPVYRYMSTQQEIQASAQGASVEDNRRAWRRALDYIGHWAWSAVIGPLVAHTRDWPDSAPTPRLVLVPMGPLGLIPWQAAWRDEGRGRRYAVQDFVLSYLASARQMCDLAARKPIEDGQALVVGNPDADLAFAGIEAQALHSAFYPQGRYLGQPEEYATGAGTPGEVLEWIIGSDGPRAMLHLACHAWVDTRQPLLSSIRLCGQRLLVKELIERAQRASQPLGTVLLAACTTNVAGTFYDEALSLGTAFVAAGARSVFGSMWRVPDSSTSLLMFMVHHYLRVEQAAPADALRSAQLWMLDPQRKPPSTMPPSLAVHVDRVGAADPVSWAGFTYLGR